MSSVYLRTKASFIYFKFRELVSARLAQSVERWTLNPTVVGSSPTLGVVLI